MVTNESLTSLQAAGVINPQIAAVANGLECSILRVVTASQNGSSSLQDSQAALGGMIGILTTLKQSGTLPADITARVNAYITAAEDGLAAFSKSQKGLDLADLTPLKPLA